MHAYEGILNVLRHYGLMDGAVAPIRPKGSPEQKLVRAAELDRYVPCPQDGVWEPVLAPGDPLEPGALIGRLHDFSDHGREALEIRATRAGYLAMMHLSARPKKGQTLYVVADEISWDEAAA
jgi:predicted deacylase